MFDNLIGHIAAAATERAPRPHMASPILPAQQCEFVYHGMGGPPFQLLHQLAHGKVWWKRYEKVDMVGRYMTFEYFHLMLLANGAYQRPGPLGDVA